MARTFFAGLVIIAAAVGIAYWGAEPFGSQGTATVTGLVIAALGLIKIAGA